METTIESFMASYSNLATAQDVAASAVAEAPGTTPATVATPATPWLFATSSFLC